MKPRLRAQAAAELRGVTIFYRFSCRVLAVCSSVLDKRCSKEQAVECKSFFDARAQLVEWLLVWQSSWEIQAELYP